MKRIIFQCVATAMCVMFAACGGGSGSSGGNSSSPSGVVDKAYKALVKGDVKTYVKVAFAVPDKLDADEAKQVEEMTQFFTQTLATMKDSDIIVKYKIIGEKIADNGLKATVNLMNTYKDGKEKPQDVKLTKVENNWTIDLF